MAWYKTGSIKATQNSNVVIGTGTDWKNNLYGLGEGQALVFGNNRVEIMYVVSNTEIRLAEPYKGSAYTGAYHIENSFAGGSGDYIRQISAAIRRFAQWVLNLQNWMTNETSVDVEMPNGEVVTLDSIKKMQGDITAKLSPGDFGLGRSNETGDKHTQDANSIKYTGFATPNGANAVNYYNSYYPLLSMTRGGGANGEGNNSQIQATPEGLAYRWMGNGNISNWQELANKSSSSTQLFKSSVEATTKLISKSADGKTSISLTTNNSGGTNIELNSASGYNGIQIPKKSGTLMLVGDYGIGRAGLREPSSVSCFYGSPSAGVPGFPSNGAGWQSTYSGNRRAMLFMNTSGALMTRFSLSSDVVDTTTPWNTVWSSVNTTVDSNGFIKRASPIIDINPDGTFTTNDESEGATVIRVSQGEYLIEGVLGFNSDAGWGGVDGGIEIPLDVNKQPLIWVNSKVNKDGSILVKTYHRTHPNAPEFARNDIDGFNDGDPIDIPDDRFISVRVQMPEQSIYNVRMREMEEAQKAEEERRQKEEEENQDTNSAQEIDN